MSDRTMPVEPITDRQHEVARLVAKGRTNGEIAGELDISLDGAKYHVSELLGRLGLERRAEIGIWYATESARTRRARLSRMLLPIGALVGIGGAAAATAVIVLIAVVGPNGDTRPANLAPITENLAPVTEDASPASFVATPSAVQIAEDQGLTGVGIFTGQMHEPGRSQHTATLLEDGRVLVAGGIIPILDEGTPRPLCPTARAEAYDPSTNEWADLGFMPAPLAGHDAVTLPDGRVLLAGSAPGEPGSTAVVFDPERDAFQAVPLDEGVLIGTTSFFDGALGRLE